MVHMLTIGDEFLQFAIASAKIVTLVLVPFPISLFNVLNHFKVTLANKLSPLSSWGGRIWCDKGNHHQGETWLA